MSKDLTEFMAGCAAAFHDGRRNAVESAIGQLEMVTLPDAYEEARREADTPSLLGRIFGRRRPLASPADLHLARGEGASCFLDKAWHGIHYLLTGTAWDGAPPLNFILAGG